MNHVRYLIYYRNRYDLLCCEDYYSREEVSKAISTIPYLITKIQIELINSKDEVIQKIATLTDIAINQLVIEEE
jgi:hypothetical protein